jgi:hypothetical protein
MSRLGKIKAAFGARLDVRLMPTGHDYAPASARHGGWRAVTAPAPGSSANEVVPCYPYVLAEHFGTLAPQWRP